MDGVPVAGWIRRRLKWARRHGWRGRVISGYRDPDAQVRAAHQYAARVGKPLWQLYPHGVLASNHVRKRYPGGAVDVTDPAELERVLRTMPRWRARKPLIGNGRAIRDDPHHFSANGR